MSNGITPIFIFSLPRSGSTLLQRLLSGNEEVTTVSEPWLLLPLVYTAKHEGAYAEYHHRLSSMALEDFLGELPNGRDDYLQAVRTMVLQLYDKASPAGSRYFLDKTPRYSLIASEIVEIFPDARFIFLWRNPLAVVASILDTWWNGRWSIASNKIDLFKGLEQMHLAQRQLGEHALSLRFEDLLINPAKELERIRSYLELEHPLNASLEAKVALKGRMGDPTGIKQYASVNSEPLEKWESTLANPLRKIWCRRYLQWIGHERLENMGYSMKLMDELDALSSSTSNLMQDLFRMPYSALKGSIDFYPLKQKLQAWRAGRKVYANR